MPHVDRNGCSLYYHREGEGETVTFVGDLGYGAWQWAWQYAAVAGPFEALTWDLRGTGRSDVPDGPYSIAELTADLEAVLSETRTKQTHLVGSGLGGLICLQYALDYHRARSLTLIGTSAGGQYLPENPIERLYAPADDEMELRETLRPVLTEAFFEEQPAVVDGIVRWRVGEREAGQEPDAGSDGRDGDAPAAGWRAQAAAIEGFDVGDRLFEVTEPALVIHGTADAVWSAVGGQTLAEGLPRGRYEPVEGGPHLVGVECSRVVDDLLVGFVERD